MKIASMIAAKYTQHAWHVTCYGHDIPMSIGLFNCDSATVVTMMKDHVDAEHPGESFCLSREAPHNGLFTARHKG